MGLFAFAGLAKLKPEGCYQLQSRYYPKLCLGETIY